MSNQINFRCTNCQTKYVASDSKAGKKIKCKVCGNSLVVASHDKIQETASCLQAKKRTSSGPQDCDRPSDDEPAKVQPARPLAFIPIISSKNQSGRIKRFFETTDRQGGRVKIILTVSLMVVAASILGAIAVLAMELVGVIEPWETAEEQRIHRAILNNSMAPDSIKIIKWGPHGYVDGEHDLRVLRVVYSSHNFAGVKIQWDILYSINNGQIEILGRNQWGDDWIEDGPHSVKRKAARQGAGKSN